MKFDFSFAINPRLLLKKRLKYLSFCRQFLLVYHFKTVVRSFLTLGLTTTKIKINMPSYIQQKTSKHSNEALVTITVLP